MLFKVYRNNNHTNFKRYLLGPTVAFKITALRNVTTTVNSDRTQPQPEKQPTERNFRFANL